MHDLQLDYVRVDYLRAKRVDREALILIHRAIRRSAHVIQRDPLQFAFQLAGRLLLHQDMPAIGQFIRQIDRSAPRPRLRPLRPALVPAGGPARRVLEGVPAASVRKFTVAYCTQSECSEPPMP